VLVELVEFIESGKFVCGIVTNHNGPRGRLEVTMSGGKEMMIAPSRILVSCEVKDPGDKASRNAFFNEVDRSREHLAAQVDLESLWSVLDGEGEEFDFDVIAGLYYGGDPSPDQLSAVIRSVQADSVFFHLSNNKIHRRTTEQIERFKANKEQQLSLNAILESGGQWIYQVVSGRLVEEPMQADQIKKMLLSYALSPASGQTASSNSENDTEAIKKAKQMMRYSGLSQEPLSAFKALVAMGELSQHENLDLLRLQIDTEFPSEVAQECANLADDFDLGAQRRIDLTGLFTATIDSPGAKEFDDALSIEHLGNGALRLGLHIADVAALIPIGSLTDDFASKRACSIYLPDGKYSMLPENITEGLLSLKKGTVKPAFSLLIELDKDRVITSVAFKPSLISIDLQLSFDEADNVIDSQHAEFFEPLLSLAKFFLEQRLDNGGYNFQLPQLNVFLNSQGLVEISIFNTSSITNFIVGEMMVMANHLAAKTLRRLGLPCPYRYQEKCNPLINYKVYEPYSEKGKLAAALAQRRLVGRRGLTLEPSPHWGLGVDVYTTFSSPIRRYIDLLVARQLRASVDNTVAYDCDRLLQAALNAEETEKAIKKMQNARKRYWLTWHLKPKIGQNFVGLVFENRGNRTRVCITDFMVDKEFYNLPMAAIPGTEVILKLTRANPREETLSFEFVKLA
jgi:exoribonuclease-2